MKFKEFMLPLIVCAQLSCSIKKIHASSPALEREQKSVKEALPDWSAIDQLLDPTDPLSLEEVSYALQEDRQKIWIDLLPASRYVLAPSSRLGALINSYHQIKKSDGALLLQRRRHLKNILSAAREELSAFALDTDLESAEMLRKATIELIIQTAANKGRYLYSLQHIPSQVLKLVFPLRVSSSGAYISTITSSKDWSRRLEDLDPAGRDNLESYFQDWLIALNNHTGSSSKFPDFYLWLEEKPSEGFRYTLRDSWFLDFESRRLKFTPEGIAFCEAFGNPIQDKTSGGRDETYIYVIDDRGDLFINDRSVHSDIKRGENVLAAGLIYFKEGKIILLTADSGHYAPRNHNLVTGVEVLKKRYGENIFHQNFQIKFWTPVKEASRIGVEDILSLLIAWPTLSEEEKNQNDAVIQQKYPDPDKYLSLNELYQIATSQHAHEKIDHLREFISTDKAFYKSASLKKWAFEADSEKALLKAVYTLEILPLILDITKDLTVIEGALHDLVSEEVRFAATLSLKQRSYFRKVISDLRSIKDKIQLLEFTSFATLNQLANQVRLLEKITMNLAHQFKEDLKQVAKNHETSAALGRLLDWNHWSSFIWNLRRVSGDWVPTEGPAESALGLTLAPADIRLVVEGKTYTAQELQEKYSRLLAARKEAEKKVDFLRLFLVYENYLLTPSGRQILEHKVPST